MTTKYSAWNQKLKDVHGKTYDIRKVPVGLVVSCLFDDMERSVALLIEVDEDTPLSNRKDRSYRVLLKHQKGHYTELRIVHTQIVAVHYLLDL